MSEPSNREELKFVFFGTDEFAVKVLEEFKRQDLLPQLIITTPGEPPIKRWAEQNHISLAQPQDPKAESCKLKAGSWQLFIVASYGKILPGELLRLPRFATLNIHPSLLPRYRGPSPIQAAILNGDRETGVSIMLVNEKVDSGPLLKAKSYKLKAKSFSEVRDELAVLGAKLLVESLPDWLAGRIRPLAQDHRRATYTRKIKKEAGLVQLDEEPVVLDRKFRAYTPWPGIYFFTPEGERVKITKAHLESGRFVIERVIPEAGREMAYPDFRRGREPTPPS